MKFVILLVLSEAISDSLKMIYLILKCTKFQQQDILPAQGHSVPSNRICFIFKCTQVDAKGYSSWSSFYSFLQQDILLAEVYSVPCIRRYFLLKCIQFHATGYTSFSSVLSSMQQDICTSRPSIYRSLRHDISCLS